MVKPCEDPSLNELLDRIVRLECKVARLQADVSPMKAQIADLFQGFKFQVDASANEILKIYHDFLWPLVHKVLPQFAQANTQIDAIINPDPPFDSRGTTE
jgi:hypothetical protein